MAQRAALLFLFQAVRFPIGGTRNRAAERHDTAAVIGRAAKQNFRERGGCLRAEKIHH
jgi:hypothetical protein